MQMPWGQMKPQKTGSKQPPNLRTLADPVFEMTLCVAPRREDPFSFHCLSIKCDLELSHLLDCNIWGKYSVFVTVQKVQGHTVQNTLRCISLRQNIQVKLNENVS